MTEENQLMVELTRRSPWKRADLLKIAGSLKAILERETSGSTGLRTFVDHYLNILKFPDDVAVALERGEINLFEAEQLARVSARRLGVTSAAARSLRTKLLRAHLASEESGKRLMARVGALLGPLGAAETPSTPASSLPSPGFSPEVMAAAAQLEAELGVAPNLDEAEDPLGEPDPSHLFYEHLQSITSALKEVQAEDLTDEVLERLYAHGDEILLILQQIKKRKQQKPSRLIF